MEQIEKRHFSEPALDDVMQRVRHEVLKGRALVVLSGFPIEKYDASTMSRVFWGLGRHLGNLSVLITHPPVRASR